MAPHTTLTDADIRQARLDNPKTRERDLADKLGITEAQLLAPHLGKGVTPLSPDLDIVIPAVTGLGEVMALTRNDSCVIEMTAVNEDYRGGPHAALVVNEDIDLRMFPRHWQLASAVEKHLPDGDLRRSIQVFDAAVDVVHKVFLTEASVAENWPSLVQDLRLEPQQAPLASSARESPEAAKGDAEKADHLRAEWGKITDTHQFLQMVRKLKMNRLGAYRIAGAPYTRQLQTKAVQEFLETAREGGFPIMLFVGNRGCIEIHTGPFEALKPMGPWLNVQDAHFNLHLRNDHLAEVWQATKSTRRGDAISVEAIDADGGLILQMFGVLEQPEAAAKWNALVDAVPARKEEALV